MRELLCVWSWLELHSSKRRLGFKMDLDGGFPTNSFSLPVSSSPYVSRHLGTSRRAYPNGGSPTTFVLTACEQLSVRVKTPGCLTERVSRWRLSHEFNLIVCEQLSVRVK